MTPDVPQPEIRALPETHTLGFVRDYCLHNLDELPELWRTFYEAPVVIPNYVPGAMFGVSFSADGLGSPVWTARSSSRSQRNPGSFHAGMWRTA